MPKHSQLSPSITIPGATEIRDYNFDVGGFATVYRRNELVASRPPTNEDDQDDGYRRGSVWVFGNTIYQCSNSDSKAAVWKNISLNSGNLATALKTSVQVASSANLVDCAGLSLPVEANSTYVGFINLQVTGGATGMDGKIDLPSGSSTISQWIKLDTAGYVPIAGNVFGSGFIYQKTSIVSPMAAGSLLVPISFATASTSGNCKFQFAQTSFPSAACAVQQNSFLQLTKIA